MVKFAELESVSEKMIDGILENVDHATLATALQGASVRLIDRVLGGRSPEAIEQVLTQVHQQQAASLAEIETARQQVAEIADDLEAAGIPARDLADRV